MMAARFEFVPSLGPDDKPLPLTLREAVFQAIGAASTCWEHMEGTGVFDSDRAREIGEALLMFVHAAKADSYVEFVEAALADRPVE